MEATRYRIFAAVTPGLEELLVRELSDLGLPPPRRRRGGVELQGERRALWRIACCSRLAESLRVRLGQSFRAVSFDELRQGAAKQPWAAYLSRGSLLPLVRVTCQRSRLYHSQAVAERVADVLSQRLSCVDPGAESGSEGRSTVFVRLVRDRVQLSVDASGVLLHRRGYRTHVGPAPLRETLAAACLAVAGYAGETPLWDPFCGAGTVPLEALAISSGRHPGTERRFAFEEWPTHDAAAFDGFRAELSRPSERRARITGSDSDARALQAAADNAARGRLAGGVDWQQGDFEEVGASVASGTMIVTNPPYGRRLDRGSRLPETYARFGELLRRRPELGPVLVLSGNRAFVKSTRLRWREVLAFKNRGLPVRLLRRN
jgi:putative N6-adenine-specific DNA methylase